MTQPRTLAQAVRFRENDRSRVEQSKMRVVVVEAELDVHGSGEVSVDVKFPVVFAEKPHLAFGHELAANQSPEAGNYPVCSATVLRWATTDLPEQRTFWTGATVGVVCLGRPAMRSIVHVAFRALAFRDPVIGLGDLTEPI